MGSNRSRAYGETKDRIDRGQTQRQKSAKRKRALGERRETGKSWESGAPNRATVGTFRAYGGEVTPSMDPKRKDKRWFRTREARESYPFCTCEIFCPKCDLDKEGFECQCTVPCAKHRWGLA
jgi:hypothetical protein